jgi:hypothetical protein
VRAAAAVVGLLLLIYTVTYGGGPHAVDEIAQLSVAASIVKRGALDTNELYWTIPAAGNRADAQSAVGPSGDAWAKKGILPSLAEVPLYAAALALPRLDLAFVALMAMIPVTALTSGLLALLAGRLGASERGALAAGLLYGLGTLAWPYSRLTFGEPLIALAVVVAALAARGGLLGVTVAGLAVAAAGAAKPSALALALPIGLYALFASPLPSTTKGRAFGHGASDVIPRRNDEGSRPPRSPRAEETRSGVSAAEIPRIARNDRPGVPMPYWARALAFAAGLAVGLAPLALYNLLRFGSPLATGYAIGSGEDFSGNPLVGLAGLLISPYRGIVWFVPLIVPAVLLLPRAWRRAPAEVALAVGVAVVTLATYAAWWTWWGGYTWGPRFLLPALPLLVLSIPLAWPALGRPARAAVACVAVLSVLAQLPGVLVDFNPFERALRERHPSFPVAGPLFDPSTSPIAGHLLRLRGEGRGALDLAWLRGGAARPGGAEADLLTAASVRTDAARPGDGTIVLASPEVPTLWAHDRWRGATYGVNRDDIPRDPDAERLLRLALARHDRLWLLAANVPREDPQNGVDRWLTREAFPLEEQPYGAARLRLFLTPSGPPVAAATAPLARLGEKGSIELAGARVLDATARTDAPPRIEVRWRLRDADARGITVFVHLYADGTLVGQVDTPLAAALPDGADLAAFAGDAIGRYAPRPKDMAVGRTVTVAIGLYRQSDGSRLPATGPDDTRLRDDLVPLGQIRIG